MKNYWLIRVQDGPVEGPFTAAQIKSMAGSGEIARQMLIADDSGNWVAAERIKGLFDQPTSSPSVPATPPPANEYGIEPAPASSHVRPSHTIEPPPLAQAPAYHSFETPPLQGRPGHIRNLGWFIVLCSIVTALGLITAVLSGIESAQRGGRIEDLFDPDAPWMPSDTFACVSFFGTVALWIVWIVWVFKVHAEVREFSNGRYPTSPGLALGLCFVPFFNIYWNIAMPYKLAQYVERESVARPAASGLAAMHMRQPVVAGAVSAGTVLALQIVGTLGGCCVQGASMLLFGISALLIQRGLNQMWQNASSTPMFP